MSRSMRRRAQPTTRATNRPDLIAVYDDAAVLARRQAQLQPKPPTQLIVAAIDPDAPGSFQLDRQRREINAAVEQAVDEFNALVDPFNELREALIAEPDNADWQAKMEETASRLAAARLAMDAAKDRRREFIVSRLETNDGTPVEDALARISLRSFEQLVTGVMHQVIVPN